MPLCLVTGACGFTGSHMVELLVKNGYRVRATDIIGHERNVNYEIIKNLGVEFISADLTNPETLVDVVKDVEYVFHIAAEFSYSAKWESLYKVNVMGTKNLCEAIVKHGNDKIQKFILWSSGSVYGLSKSEYQGIMKGYYPNPSNLYGKSKHLQEFVALEYWEEYGLPVVIMRCSPIYGPRNFYGLLQVWLTYLKFPVVIMPKRFPIGFPYVHVKDVCGAALFLAEKERRFSTVYDIVDDQGYDVLEFFKILCQYLNRKIIQLPISYKFFTGLYKITAIFARIMAQIIPIDVFRYLRETVPYATVDYRFSNRKIKKFGYQFQYPHIKDGLKEVLEWLSNNGYLKIKRANKMEQNKLDQKKQEQNNLDQIKLDQNKLKQDKSEDCQSLSI